MDKPGRFRLEAAGWGFWIASTIVLAGPFIYVSYQVTEDHLSHEVPVGIGIIGAAIAGAFVTLIANTIIQRSLARRKVAERKQTKTKHKK